MAPLATVPSERSVEQFVQNIGNPAKEADCRTLLQLFEEVSGQEPVVWGNAKAPYFLIGFGRYRYTRKGSKEVLEWFRMGFSVRKTKLTLYFTLDISQEGELLAQLGKCSWGKGCLYLNKLADIDLKILRQLLEKSKDSSWH